MPTINIEYFIGAITIAQTDQQAVQENVELYIERYEPKFLEEYLGYAFSQLYIAGVAAETQKYLDIQDGVTWTNQYGITVKWKGLIQVAGDYNFSPIANYIYWHYMRDQAEIAGGIGVVQTTAENAIRVSPIRKQVTAWNDMCDTLYQMYHMLLHRRDDNGDLVYGDFDKTAVCYPEKQNVLNL